MADNKGLFVMYRNDSRLNIWIVLGAILICVGVLSWDNIFNLKPKIESQSFIIDSLRASVVHRDSQLVFVMEKMLHTDSARVKVDSFRLFVDQERMSALEEWRKEKAIDNVRKDNYDKDFPKYAPRK